MRYVRPLRPEQRDLLENIMKTDTSFRARTRAHSLLLSDFSTGQIFLLHRTDFNAF
jgi:hypothetical protein